jgi:Fe-S oxidoreductase
MQCGTCSATCVSRYSFNLRKILMEWISKNRHLESNAGLWDCTTCLNCQKRCPRGIPLTQIIIDSRKMIIESGKAPPDIRDMLISIQKHRNPYGESKHKRSEWMKDLNIKHAKDGEFEWLWYIGCANSYDPRGREIAIKTAEILDEMGIYFAVLGNEEGCCGNDVLRVGEEGLFESLREENHLVFRKYGVRRILTSSPHCYNTFKNEYQGYDVMTVLEMIYWGIKTGILNFRHDVEAKVTFHDPCYLGRYNGIYDAPREILASIYGIELVEMSRNRENSFCCGGGGGNILRDNLSRPNVIRAREASLTGADIVAVACPFCLTMLEDGLKSIGKEITVMDIIELVHLAVFGE